MATTSKIAKELKTPKYKVRLRNRILNLGVLCSLAIFAVVAIVCSFCSFAGAQFCLNGMPMNCRSFRASSSVFAVVTNDTFMPRALSTFM